MTIALSGKPNELIMNDIPFEHSSVYAWAKYKETVTEITSLFDRADIIEIGAGRTPLFDKGDIPENIASYTINDISQRELDLAPEEWQKSCFDVCGDVGAFKSRYDVAFSKMLAEHVPDGYRFHSNIFEILKPGGTSFHFMPILYSPPFVINKILPETLTRVILRALFKNRVEDEAPKFPAYYSMCYGASAKLVERYKSIGFAQVDIQTFYGHDYFKKIPGLREIDRVFSEFAYKQGLTRFGSYAYARLVKPK